MIAKKYIYLFIFSLILSLSFFLTNLFYKDELYAKYSISIFENALLPDNIFVDPKTLGLDDYRSQLFDNCERKDYSSELLNFRYRRINSFTQLDFIFKEDNDKLNVEIESCINQSFANYKILIQEYFKETIAKSHMNDKFIDLINDYLIKMKIEPMKVKKGLNNFGYEYNRLNFSKNYEEPENELKWLLTYTKPNIMSQDKTLFKKNNINKISLFLIILINFICFTLITYFIFKRK